MSTNTSRFALVKPAPSENYDVAVWNANSDKVAAQLGFKPVTLSTFPASPVQGETVMATDDGNSLWVSNGSAPASGSWMQLQERKTWFGPKIGEVANNTTSFTQDATVRIANVKPGLYALTGNVFYRSSTAADFKCRFTFSGTSDLRWGNDGSSAANAAIANYGMLTNTDTSVISTSSGTLDRFFVQGRLTVSAVGTLILEWAQFAFDAAGNTTLLEGSWIRLEKMT